MLDLCGVRTSRLVMDASSVGSSLTSLHLLEKNAMNIMLKNLLDACGGAIGFYCLGWGIAYGGDQTGLTFAGSNNFALQNFAEDDASAGYA